MPEVWCGLGNEAMQVADSSGNPALEAAAIKAVSKYEFTPALLDGKAVDAGINGFKFKFVLTDLGKGANQDFAHQYRALLKAVEVVDRNRADAVMQRMKVQNLYEDAYYNFARYMYFQQWGTEQQRVEALRRAIAYEQKASYLPTSMFKSAVTQLFVLQVRMSDFGGAIETYRLLDAAFQRDPSVMSAVADIQKLQYDHRPYSFRTQLSGNGAAFVELLKRRFTVLVTAGRIAEMKLYCETKFVLIRYERDLDYTIPPEYGHCSRKLNGDPDTQVTLIQS